MRRTVTTSVLVGVLLFSAAGTIYSRQSLKWEKVYLQSPVLDDTVYLPSETALKLATMGYSAFFGDMLFIRTHAYYMRHYYGDRILTWIDPPDSMDIQRRPRGYSEAILSLDPDNREVYYWTSIVVRYGQMIDEEVIRRSIRWAERGVERFPDDARLYAQLGFNRQFELKKFYDEKRIVLERQRNGLEQRPLEVFGVKSSNWLNNRFIQNLQQQLADLRRARNQEKKNALLDYTIAAMLPGDTVNPLFLITLYIQQDLFDAASQMIATFFAEASDDDKKTMLVRMDSLGKKKEAEKLRTAEKKRKNELPFVNPSLFSLVGNEDAFRVPKRWDEVGRVYDDALKVLETENGSQE